MNYKYGKGTRPHRCKLALDSTASWFDQTKVSPTVETEGPVDETPKMPLIYEQGLSSLDEFGEQQVERHQNMADLFSNPKTGGLVDEMDFDHIMEPSIEHPDMMLHSVIGLHKGNEVAALNYTMPDDRPGELHVQGIGVDKEYRRNGIGTRLFDELHRKYPDHSIVHNRLSDDGFGLVQTLEGDEHQFDETDLARSDATWVNDPQNKQKLISRYEKMTRDRICVFPGCDNIINRSENGSFTGFCQTHRENQGLVDHAWDSEKLQEGHYG